MTAPLTAAPILPVADMTAATAFYRELGFVVVAHDDRYALVVQDGAELFHLRQAPGLDPADNLAALYLHVGNADQWHAAWRDGPAGVTDPEDQPWGMREFSLRDPSGNLIRVGHPL